MATTRRRGMPCNRTASLTCDSFHTIVRVGIWRTRPLLVRLSQLATMWTLGTPRRLAARR